jgi:nucleotide sugar dehydrogenase
MQKFKIGIVGNGFVGSAICKGLNHYHDVKIYDVNSAKSTHSFDETITQDIVFVCLPTPMFKDTLGSDTSYIVDFFNTVITYAYNPQTIFVIKSTVPIGTTDYLCEKFSPLKIIHSPEFLTARSAAIDFITPSRNIVGGEEVNGTLTIKKLYEERFPGVPCHVMKSKESEFVKYFANCFFATKVSFFNEMFLLSDKLNLSWDKILGGVMSDGRIGISHYQVPGHDNDFGFGGTCFPKDINAFIETFEKFDIDPVILKAAWNRNLSVRKNKDWEKSKSAVTDNK